MYHLIWTHHVVYFLVSFGPDRIATCNFMCTVYFYECFILYTTCKNVHVHYLNVLNNIFLLYNAKSIWVQYFSKSVAWLVSDWFSLQLRHDWSWGVSCGWECGGDTLVCAVADSWVSSGHRIRHLREFYFGTNKNYIYIEVLYRYMYVHQYNYIAVFGTSLYRLL